MQNLTVILQVAIVCAWAGCSANEGTPRPSGRVAAGSGGMGGAIESPVIPTSPTDTSSTVMNPGPTVIQPPSVPPPALAAGSGSPGECGAVMQTAQNTLQPIDIIVSIDTSGTMRDEAMFVKENMNAFSQQIKDAGVDVHVVLISSEWTGMDDGFGGLLFTDGLCIAAPLGSGMCPNDSNPPGYAHVIEIIGQWNILDAYILRYPDYKQHLRENSLKTFVSVSDADSSTPADKFINDVMALDPGSSMWANWRYAAIYPFAACGDGQPGLVHADLVMRTQGVGGDLCQQDFAPVFDAIAKKLVDVVQLSCDWEIPSAPNMEEFDRNKTNVELMLQGQSETLLKSQSSAACGDKEGWHYDDEANPARVVVCPATCARIQAAESAQINLLFGCETQINPG